MHSNEELIHHLVSQGVLKTPRIIDAFRRVDRRDFVLDEYKNTAYEDHPLPIGENQTISQPFTVAFMLELLQPNPGEKILDIGSGSGWTTALLTYIASQDKGLRTKNRGAVMAIERIPELCEFGNKNIGKYNFGKRLEILCGDATKSLFRKGPFDKILASAAASKEIPNEWKEELREGGMIVAPVRDSIWQFSKKPDGTWEEREFHGFAFVPLIASGEKPARKNIKKAGIPKNKNIIACLVFILALGLVGVNEVYSSHASFEGRKKIVIPEGLGSRKIAVLLKDDGFIRSKWAFVIYVTFRDISIKLKPGEYTFFSDMDIAQIAADLVRGGARETILTVPEGWTAGDIARELQKQDVLESHLFLDIAGYPNMDYRLDHKVPIPKDFSQEFSFLLDKPEFRGLEGYLFPDTYRVYKDADPDEIIRKMLENFDAKLTSDLHEEIARQKKTIFEIVTLASLIEKEVQTDEDRAIVSGIFQKRISIGMPLQVDATINYITGVSTTNISAKEKQIDSPYNTYRYKGLPFGPIANPSISAIRAAIYPTKSAYLYYLSTPEGKTIFSKSLEEHNAAKKKYLR